jgi:hypothetical protein
MFSTDNVTSGARIKGGVLVLGGQNDDVLLATMPWGTRP